MGLQHLIDNLPLILVSFGFLLWAAARLVEAKAKANPSQDAWDVWQPRLTWASHLYSQAIDWLCAARVLNLAGEAKLNELNKLVKAFEGKISSGKYLEAINDVVGFWTAAKNKNILGAVPPASVPLPGSQVAGPSGAKE